MHLELSGDVSLLSTHWHSMSIFSVPFFRALQYMALSDLARKGDVDTSVCSTEDGTMVRRFLVVLQVSSVHSILLKTFCSWVC